MEKVVALRPGDCVEVFFRSRHDEHGCFPVTDALSAQLRPRVGWTDGWVPARVLEERPLGTVRVCHTHPLWSNRNGDLLCEKELAAAAAAAAAACLLEDGRDSKDAIKLANAAKCTGCFTRADVRIAADGVPPAPVMSVVVVRWGGETTDFNESQWGELSSSVSDRYIHSFLDHTYKCLGPAYEVLSIFVETGADLARVPLGALSSRLRGAHRCALYFLWPTLAQDGGDDQQMGMLPAADVFGAMRRAEAAGLPTRFPHPSQLYATLLSKASDVCCFYMPAQWTTPC